MNQKIKWFYITGLFLISVSASLFMIIESGDFYQRLYQSSNSIIPMGYWAAALNEVFMAIMAGVWLPARSNKKGEKKEYWVNYFFKFLLVLLFITTVGGASLNVADDILNEIEKQQARSEIIKVVQSQISDNQEALQTFIDQNQRGNSAITVREQRTTREELKKILEQQKDNKKLWIDILLIITLRFVVQLANLSCVWLLGWVYRTPIEQKRISPSLNKDEPVQKENTVDKTMPEITFKAVLNKSGEPEAVNKEESIQKENIVDKTMPEVTFKAVRDERGEPETVKKEEPKEIKPALKRETNEKKTNIRYLSRDPAQKEEQGNTNKVRALCREITKLVYSRNHGVSLQDFCLAIGESEEEISSIIHFKKSAETISPIRLESILTKIQTIYQEELSFSLQA